jgi:hypothetical protein
MVTAFCAVCGRAIQAPTLSDVPTAQEYMEHSHGVIRGSFPVCADCGKGTRLQEFLDSGGMNRMWQGLLSPGDES